MPERAQPGQPFVNTPFTRASVQNSVLEATEHYQQQRLGGGGAGSFGGPRDGCKVMVKNLTGDPITRGSVVKVGAHLLNTASRILDASQWFEGNIQDYPLTKCAITLTPLVENQIGEAFIAGECVARVLVNDVTHKFAKPVDDETYLTSDVRGPFEILGTMPGSTGEANLSVRFVSDIETAIIEVYGNSVSVGEIPTFAQAYHGRVRAANLGSPYDVGSTCYVQIINSHDLTTGYAVVTEGNMLVARFAGWHDFGSGVRPVFEARSPFGYVPNVGLSLNGNWTVTNNAATLIPLDEGWPVGYSTATNMVYANATPGTDSSKIYLHYAWNTYRVGFTVSFELPATVTGTQFAQNSEFRFFPITIQPYLDGSALTGHEKYGSLWVPPESVTTGAASAGTAHTHPVPFTVEKVTTNNDFSGQQVTVSGERTIDAGLGYSAGSYVQLKITGAIDAVVRRADLWVESTFHPPA